MLFTAAVGAAAIYGGWWLLRSRNAAAAPAAAAHHTADSGSGLPPGLPRSTSGRSYSRVDSGRSQGSDPLGEQRRVQFVNDGRTDSNVRQAPALATYLTSDSISSHCILSILGYKLAYLSCSIALRRPCSWPVIQLSCTSSYCVPSVVLSLT